MDSMEEIYKAHAKTVYGFLLTKTRDSDLAEELTQETFYRAVRQIGSFRGESGVSTWLCAIAKNVWLEYLKKKKRQPDAEALMAENRAGESAEESHILMWEQMRILRALHELKEPMRETVYLRLAGNLTFAQIGDIMGKSENWARVTFYRGKELIMKEVKKDEP